MTMEGSVWVGLKLVFVFSVGWLLFERVPRNSEQIILTYLIQSFKNRRFFLDISKKNTYFMNYFLENSRKIIYDFFSKKLFWNYSTTFMYFIYFNFTGLEHFRNNQKKILHFWNLLEYFLEHFWNCDFIYVTRKWSTLYNQSINSIAVALGRGTTSTFIFSGFLLE